MDEDEEHWFDEADENENGDAESKVENGVPTTEEEPSSSKLYTPLTSVKSLAPINAAPPVKRTLLVWRVVVWQPFFVFARSEDHYSNMS